MKQKLKQIIYEMRHQPVISGVTFIATALSVFLIMVVVIMQRVKTVPFPPESCREQLMVGKYIHITMDEAGHNDSSGALSYPFAQTLYSGLNGVEHVSFISEWLLDMLVKGTEKTSFSAKSRAVDAEFFKIFDHPLIAGRYFTAEEANSRIPVVVITESTARKAFGKTDCVGENISLDHNRYTVVGVIKDHSFLATTAASDIFTTYGPGAIEPGPKKDVYELVFGDTFAALLVKKGVDFQSVKDQVKARYAILATELKPYGFKPIYHDAPYDQETIVAGLRGSNNTPDPSPDRHMRYILYAILLIVPAMNLSSLLHSRMFHRVSEIGVRRAFGCTRTRIITDIIAENFIVTLVGGIVGLILGVVFAMTYSGLYENMDNTGLNLTPALSSVINWGTILIAIGVCFILNIISASIPAWQASRLNPVEAINKK